MTMMQQPANAGRTQGPYSTRCDNFFSDLTAPAQPWLGKAGFSQRPAVPLGLMLSVAIVACLGWNIMKTSQAAGASQPDAQSSPVADQQPKPAPNQQSGTAPAVSAPIVHAPVAPQTQDTDLKTLPTTQPHAPGGPVRERQDLQRSDGQRK